MPQWPWLHRPPWQPSDLAMQPSSQGPSAALGHCQRAPRHLLLVSQDWLCCAVLCCAVLCCAGLCCAVLCSAAANKYLLNGIVCYAVSMLATSAKHVSMHQHHPNSHCLVTGIGTQHIVLTMRSLAQLEHTPNVSISLDMALLGATAAA